MFSDIINYGLYEKIIKIPASLTIIENQKIWIFYSKAIKYLKNYPNLNSLWSELKQSQKEKNQIIVIADRLKEISSDLSPYRDLLIFKFTQTKDDFWVDEFVRNKFVGTQSLGIEIKNTSIHNLLLKFNSKSINLFTTSSSEDMVNQIKTKISSTNDFNDLVKSLLLLSNKFVNADLKVLILNRLRILFNDNLVQLSSLDFKKHLDSHDTSIWSQLIHENEEELTSDLSTQKIINLSFFTKQIGQKSRLIHYLRNHLEEFLRDNPSKVSNQKEFNSAIKSVFKGSDFMPYSKDYLMRNSTGLIKFKNRFLVARIAIFLLIVSVVISFCIFFKDKEDYIRDQTENLNPPNIPITNQDSLLLIAVNKIVFSDSSSLSIKEFRNLNSKFIQIGFNTDSIKKQIIRIDCIDSELKSGYDSLIFDSRDVLLNRSFKIQFKDSSQKKFIKLINL